MSYKIVKDLCTKYNASNTSRIKYIVIHYTAGSKPGAGAAYNNCEYYRTSSVSASAHYYVDEGSYNGTIYQSVPDEHAAWSVGSSTYRHPYARNSNTLNIEMCSGKLNNSSMSIDDLDWYIPEKTVLATIELTKDLMKKYGIPASNVIRHYDVVGWKKCPAPFMDNYKPVGTQNGWTWSKFKAALTQSTPKEYKEGDSNSKIKSAKESLYILGFDVDPATNKFGKKLTDAVKKYQGMYAIKKTGRLDPVTLNSIEVEACKMNISSGENSDRVLEYKKKLSYLGFTVDTNTRKFGAKMHSAVLKYQGMYGIPKTGKINNVTGASICYEYLKKNGKIKEVKKTTQASALKGKSEKEVISIIKPLCKADEEKTGVCCSVTMAQFILESGWGSTELSQNANNCFGMKTSLSGNTWPGSSWDGTSKYTKKTEEQDSNGYVSVITADFRKYKCIEDSISDHSAYLTGAKNGSNLRYSGLKGCKDYKKAISIIKNGGYATDTKYVDKVCSIIERYGLS